MQKSRRLCVREMHERFLEPALQEFGFDEIIVNPVLGLLVVDNDLGQGEDRRAVAEHELRTCLLGKAGTHSIFEDQRFSFDEAVEAYESVLLLDAARFQSLLLMGEERAAMQHAQKFVDWHHASVSQLAPGNIASVRSKSVDTAAERDLRHEWTRKAKDFKELALEIHRHLVERIHLVLYLLEKGISGRAYVEELRQRMDTPFVLLPVG